MGESEFTTIGLRYETRDRLKARGSKGESYDQIVRRLRRSIQQVYKELGVDETATMLDVHNIVWIYNCGENEP